MDFSDYKLNGKRSMEILRLDMEVVKKHVSLLQIYFLDVQILFDSQQKVSLNDFRAQSRGAEAAIAFQVLL